MAMRKQLKDICRGFTKNIALKDLGQHEGQFPIYGASGYIKDVDFYCCDTPYIGIVKDGSGVGRVDVYPGYSSLLGTMQYIVPNDEVDLQYLKYALIAMDLGSLYKGAAIPHIYFKEYGKFFVDLPDLETQKHISASLDTIQKAIDLKRKQLLDLDELVKSKFQEMFGDIRTNDKNWDFVLLNEICDVRDGTHDSPKYHESGYPLLTSKNFTSGEIDMQEVKYISKEDYDAINIRSKVDCGDVVLPMIGTIGHPVVIDVEPEFAIKNVALIKFGTSKYSNYFIKQILDSEYFKHYVVMHNKGNTQKFVSLGDIRAFPIPMVPFQLQQENETFVKKVIAASAIIKQEISDLEELMDSKMDEYFG